MKAILKNPALIIVDVQKVPDDPKPDQLNNPRAEKNIAEILDKWRNKRLPRDGITIIQTSDLLIFASGGQGGSFRENRPPGPPAKAFI
jgi:nicotinamidase-related amidase